MPLALKLTVTGTKELESGISALKSNLIGAMVKPALFLALTAAKAKLRKPAARPTYPINWDSERQRRAYFATDGFGAGIPYRRTGRYELGFMLSETTMGYALTNDTEPAIYIGGDDVGGGQSRIHKGRWPLWIQIVEQYIAQLGPQIESRITKYWDDRFR